MNYIKEAKLLSNLETTFNELRLLTEPDYDKIREEDAVKLSVIPPEITENFGWLGGNVVAKIPTRLIKSDEVTKGVYERFLARYGNQIELISSDGEMHKTIFDALIYDYRIEEKVNRIIECTNIQRNGGKIINHG